MVFGAVLGTIIYRISIVSVIYGGGDQFIQRHAKIFTSMMAAIINLIIIMILTRVCIIDNLIMMHMAKYNLKFSLRYMQNWQLC